MSPVRRTPRVNRSGRTPVVYARSGRTMDTYSTGRVTAVSSLHCYRVDRTTNSQQCVSLYVYMYMYICVCVYIYITCSFGASTCRLAHAPLRSDSLITLELAHLPITVVAFHLFNFLHFSLFLSTLHPVIPTSEIPPRRFSLAPRSVSNARYRWWTLDRRILKIDR